MRKDAPLAAEQRDSFGERNLESENHACRTRMRAHQNDARFSYRFELVFEQFVFALVRTYDADRDWRTEVLCHACMVPQNRVSSASCLSRRSLGLDPDLDPDASAFSSSAQERGSTHSPERCPGTRSFSRLATRARRSSVEM